MFDSVPTVMQKDGFSFMIYTMDHEPRHIHVWKAGKEVIVNLGDETVAPFVRENNGMDNKNKRKALGIAGEEQEFLIAEWRRIHGDA
jgi:hypothetical protein